MSADCNALATLAALSLTGSARAAGDSGTGAFKDHSPRGREAVNHSEIGRWNQVAAGALLSTARA